MAARTKATEMTAFVKYVRDNDLLLRGRDLDQAPEGAGSWRYLIAAWMGVEPREVTAQMVAEVKASDTKAREAAKAAKAKASPAKAAKAAKAPAAVAKAAAPAADDLASVKADVAALTSAIGDILTMLGEK